MLKKIIIAAIIVVVPTAFYVASKYGKLESLTFEQAVQQSTTETEGDQAPKALIHGTVLELLENRILCTDQAGVKFSVEYTGKPPDKPFAVGMRVDLVGHVHGGSEPYFHATQAYIQ